MASQLDEQKLKVVFEARPDILEGIKSAADSPSRIALFNNIASFVHDQINGAEPATKRRRVDDGSVATLSNGQTTSAGKTANPAKPAGGASAAESAATEDVQLEIKEISVSVPQRKKFELCFTDNYLYARAPNTTGPALNIAYAWEDIEYAFYLPVPEKTQVQHNYVLFPRGSYLPTRNEAPTAEPFVFTVAATAPKQGTIAGPKADTASAVSDSYHSLFDWALSTFLSAASNPIPIVAADPSRFHSMVKQPHRPSEKAVHVKAFRGSKDGYLFFLPNGILWGFKKPLLFMPLERIAAVSYTSVLQRTFNMVVEVFTNVQDGDGATEEIEFSMLDQEDYQGIDESYVKRNRLQDGSMAEQRRAKLELAENMKGAKKGDGATLPAANGGVGPDGMTELERAQAEADQQQQQQQQLDEEEDEEDEEDYDPGSEGESEGSGVSSDEEGDEDMEDADGDDNGDDEEEEEGTRQSAR